jgi:tetratricopeptide (TPR) repeat protein
MAEERRGFVGSSILRQPPPVTNPEAALAIGLKALDALDELSGIAVIEGALSHHPREPQLWQVLGLLHRSRDDLAPAIAAFDRAAALASRDARIAHGRARAHLEGGRPAAGLFAQAQALAPDDEAVVLGRASAELAEGRPEAAVELLSERLRRTPAWAFGHSALSKLRWMTGDQAGFTASFDEALKAAPRDLSLWREYIAADTHAGRYEAALEVIARGRTAAGPHLIFDAYEAACFDDLGRPDRAAAFFDALGPLNDHTLAVYKVRHLLRSGRPKEAARLAEGWIQGPFANAFWPYLSIAWRFTGDARWQWLEGDERLVGIYDLGERLGSIESLAALLRRLHVATCQPLEQSVRGGTQTDGQLFTRVDPEIRQLRAAVVEAVERHLRQLPPPDPRHPTLAPRRDRPVRFSGSWSVRLKGEGHHANHLHPGGWLSSALYVALPDEAERGAPPAGWLSLGQPQEELGIALEPFRLVEPKPGRLVLFPSTMWHGTVPFEAGERLTVAFDVAPPR